MFDSSFIARLKTRSFIGVVGLILLIAVLPHAFNMFNYPYYENDEGTYMAQAWSTVTQGRLAPYTYWYDHAPVGWIAIGFWSTFTNGFNTFGFSINSGRVFMLVMHVLSSILLVRINYKIFKSYWPGLGTVLLFSLSPLGIYFQRRVLLDNIMVFWMLLSLDLILGDKRKLWHFLGSAITMSLAFLSKESAVYFIPAMMLIIFLDCRKYHSKIPLLLWTVLAVAIISLYPLYALLKGEFFQTGTLLGGTAPHVSLLETAAYQASRPGGFFLNANSDFMVQFTGWMRGSDSIYSDPMLIGLGLIATIYITLLSIRRSHLRPISLLTLAYWYFLARGGIVIEFYVIPLIPLLALSISASIYVITVWIVDRYSVRSFGFLILAITLFAISVLFIDTYASRSKIYTRDNTTDQINAVNWITQNVPTNSFLLSDMYAYIELSKIIKLTHYYWKADRDPEITEGLLKGSWCNVDYILVTPQLIHDAKTAVLSITQAAYDHSDVLVAYRGNGWDVEVRKVNKTECTTTHS